MDGWKLDGTYMEACNCEIACPCVFLSAPTEGECKALVGWHIEEGSYGDVELDGLNVALALHSPGHMLEVPWRVALYLDERASEEQEAALTDIFSGQAGGHPALLGEHIGEVLGVAKVPIEFRRDGGSRSLRVGSVGEAEIEAIEGQGERQVTIEHHPLAVSPGYPAVVAQSETLRFADHGLQFEISEKNGYFSPFTYTA